MNAYAPLPLSLYVHYPWCVRKCPYCDFSSFAKGADLLRDQKYLQVLKKDFLQNIDVIADRKFVSVYFGGGTPSLCPPEFFEDFIEFLTPYLGRDCEISMEANPGTVTLKTLQGYKKAGLNRISIGVQSFNDASLKKLGRIHRSESAIESIEVAKEVGFSNINIDLMHGLPDQSVEDALYDLNKASELGANHISWYELTIEEGTYFGKHPPSLPDEDVLAQEEKLGFEFLKTQGFERYEVSAFAKNNQKCVHNRNYWLFNDYLGLGAGGCGKIFCNGVTRRRSCPENPAEYMNGNFGAWCEVNSQNLPFEFALNRLRLFGNISKEEFSTTTGLPFTDIAIQLHKAVADGLLHMDDKSFELTHLGKLMLNDILELFL